MRWVRELVCSSVVVAMVVSCSAAAQPKQAAFAAREEAGRHYDKGSAAQKNGDWQSACDQYALAYDMFQHPQILVSLGRAELKVGKYRRAAEHLMLFLSNPPKLTATERAAYEKDLAEAKKHVGILGVSAEPGADVLVDGKKAGTVPASGKLELFVDAGSHGVEARSGQKLGSGAISVQAGKTVSMALTMMESSIPAAHDANAKMSTAVAPNGGASSGATRAPVIEAAASTAPPAPTLPPPALGASSAVTPTFGNAASRASAAPPSDTTPSTRGALWGLPRVWLPWVLELVSARRCFLHRR